MQTATPFAASPEDCVFADPMKKGVTKLTNIANYAGEKDVGIAAYNLTGSSQKYMLPPKNVRELPTNGNYLIYSYFDKSIVLCGGSDIIAPEMQMDGFTWFQILPYEGSGVFLGLTEEYAGFSAVESVYAAEHGMTGIITEYGPTGFVSERKPGKILCNGLDVTGLLVQGTNSGGLEVYTVNLPVSNGKAVIEVFMN